MKRKNIVLVVVPAHNEAANLPVVLGELAAARPECDVVVVDDGSSDGSGAVAKESGANVVRHAVRRGYGAALVSGYKHAIEHGHDVVVTVDGDGQHDPAQIGRLLEGLSRFDVVIGARALDRPGYPIGLARRAGIRLFAALGRALTGKRITDPTSGFTAIRGEAVAFLAANTPDDFPDLNVILALHRAGFAVGEVEVTMRARRSGESMLRGVMPVIYVAKMVRYVAEVVRAAPRRDVERRPMREPSS